MASAPSTDEEGSEPFSELGEVLFDSAKQKCPERMEVTTKHVGPLRVLIQCKTDTYEAFVGGIALNERVPVPSEPEPILRSLERGVVHKGSAGWGGCYVYTRPVEDAFGLYLMDDWTETKVQLHCSGIDPRSWTSDCKTYPYYPTPEARLEVLRIRIFAAGQPTKADIIKHLCAELPGAKALLSGPTTVEHAQLQSCVQHLACSLSLTQDVVAAANALPEADQAKYVVSFVHQRINALSTDLDFILADGGGFCSLHQCDATTKAPSAADDLAAEMICHRVPWEKVKADTQCIAGPDALDCKASVRAYTGSWFYDALNKDLREGKGNASDWKWTRQGISAGLCYLRLQSPLSSGTCLYRGVSNLFGAVYEVGQDVFWPAYTSTSTNKIVAQNFGNGRLLFIIIGLGKDSNAAKVRLLSVYPSEEEVLLDAGTVFTVVGKQIVGDVLEITLQVKRCASTIPPSTLKKLVENRQCKQGHPLICTPVQDRFPGFGWCHSCHCLLGGAWDALQGKPDALPALQEDTTWPPEVLSKAMALTEGDLRVIQNGGVVFSCVDCNYNHCTKCARIGGERNCRSCELERLISISKPQGSCEVTLAESSAMALLSDESFLKAVSATSGRFDQPMRSQHSTDGRTWLYVAARNGFALVTKRLLQLGASTLPRITMGSTCLHAASYYRRHQCVEAIVSSISVADSKLLIAVVNNLGLTAIEEAKDPEIKTLLQKLCIA